MIELVKMVMAVILASHLMACVWIGIGQYEDEGWVNQFLSSQETESGYVPKAIEHFFSIYANAFYFVLTTITTVGYGDITGSTSIEYGFSMIVMFFGLTFFSLLSGTIQSVLSSDESFDSLIQIRMDQLDHWILRLEATNNNNKLPCDLYHSIKVYIEDAFLFDYNLIIEEYDFYQKLPSDIQNRVNDSLFGNFKENFHFFFHKTEIGF